MLNGSSTLWSNASSISIKYNPVNDIPVALDTTVTVQEDASIAIPFNVTDGESDPLGVRIVSLPPSGTAKLILSTTGEELEVGSYINLTVSSVMVRPVPNYHGHFNFAFEATDAFIGSNTLWSNTAAVVVTVTSVNDLPSAFDTSVDNAEDESRVLQFNASDIDGDSLYFKIHTTPINTQASLVWSNDTTKLVKPGDIVPQGGVRLLPAANFRGKISFTYSVTDFVNGAGTHWRGPFFYNIDYKPQNDQVQAYNSTYIVNEDTILTISFNVTDADEDDLYVKIKDIPASSIAKLTLSNGSVISMNGTIIPAATQLIIRPANNYFGTLEFSFLSTDNYGMPNTSWTSKNWVKVTYTPVNDIPLVFNSSYTILEDTSASIYFNVSDIDNDQLVVRLTSMPPSSVAQFFVPGQSTPISIGQHISTDHITVVPASNFAGEFNVSFETSDSRSSQNMQWFGPGHISVAVTPLNDPPTVKNVVVAFPQQSSEVPIDLIGEDAENDVLTFLIDSLPEVGVLLAKGDFNTSTNSWNYFRITKAPFMLAPGDSSVIFRSPPAQGSSRNVMFLYSAFDGVNYSINNASVAITTPQSTPFLDRSGLNLNVLEDTEATFNLNFNNVNPNHTFTVTISNLEINGSLIDMASQGQRQLVRDSRLSGPPYIVKYIPSRNFFSSTPSTFQLVALNIVHGPFNVIETIRFPVMPVNDPPVIKCPTGPLLLPTDQLQSNDTEMPIFIDASDADDSSVLTFTLTVPRKGFLKEGNTNRILSDGSRFSNPNLIFKANSSGGGLPYANFTIQVADQLNSSSNPCTFVLSYNCPTGTYNNTISNSGPICILCPPGYSCETGEIIDNRKKGQWTINENTSLPCYPQEACTGSLQQPCSIGYKGFRCGECTKDHYRHNMRCYSCQNQPEILQLAVFVVSLMCLMGLFIIVLPAHAVTSTGASVTIISFLQVITIFSPTFSSILQSTFAQLNVILLDIGLIAPECLLKTIDFGVKEKLLAFLFLPVISIICILFGFMIRSILQCAGKRLFKTTSNDDLVAKIDGHNAGLTVRKIWKTVMVALMLLYLPISKQFLQIANLRLEVDGNYYLAEHPSIQYLSASWYQSAMYAVIGAGVYMIGIPLFYTILIVFLSQSKTQTSWLLRARAIANTILDPENSQVKPSNHSILVLSILKRLSIIMLFTFVRDPLLQLVFYNVTLVLELAYIMWNRPFTSKGLNMFEVLVGVSTLLILNTDIARMNNFFNIENMKEYLSMVILSLIGVCVLCWLYLVYKDTLRKQRKQSRDLTSTQSRLSRASDASEALSQFKNYGAPDDLGTVSTAYIARRGPNGVTGSSSSMSIASHLNERKNGYQVDQSELSLQEAPSSPKLMTEQDVPGVWTRLSANVTRRLSLLSGQPADGRVMQRNLGHVNEENRGNQSSAAL
ncbi:hypothetical protein BKA69DRAFT_1084054 [Paraphysoderma sedebokerense]|nr:hypothetical protein BKA69DRAFT_1084054 [Paraphysoderma sedebokerense]